MDLLKKLNENPFVLAPMAGITDHAFRSFMREMGAGVVVTELVSATGIDYSSTRTLNLMSFGEDQHPIGIQLFGEDPETMANAARVAEEKGCDFIDINLGCPVPKVVKKGAGSALLKDLPQLKLLLRGVKSAIQIPLTIKIRTGWDANSKNAAEVIQLAYDEGVTWVAIHGRTRAQGYSGQADWDFIAELKAKSPLPILGNGDITSAKMAIEKKQFTGCDGIMIGRGALKNPFIFRESLQLYNQHTSNLSTQEHSAQQDHTFDNNFAQNHSAKLLDAYHCLHKHLAKYCASPILLIQLKKFAAWYSSGYAGSSQFRKHIFQCDSVNGILETTEVFFKNVAHQEDTSHESFLMGGHG